LLSTGWFQERIRV